MSPPLASIVIPTCRRPALLARCLEAIERQTWDAGEFEVIVVDDGHDDAVERIVGEARHPSATFVRLRTPRPRSGPAVARNIGWRRARAALVAFTDDDCVPHPGWLAAGTEALRDGAAGAWGHVIVPLPPDPTDYERDAAHLETSPFATASCFYRREALDQVGGFDERFTMAWREDSDLHFRILKRGLRLVRASAEAVVTHPVRPAGWGVSLFSQKKAQFEALLYLKHPDLYRAVVRPRPMWRYHATLAFALAAAAGTALGRPNVSLAAMGAWGLLTARFCALRLEGTSRRPGHMLEMALTSILIPPLSLFWRFVGAIRFGAFVP
jgi:glycosyltransferase involved in cell wall biosynthesis